jgi:hypothetical protein
MWKNGITLCGEPVRFNKELTKSTVFVDLRNGEAHCVLSVYKAKEHSREMPEDVVQTLLMKTLPDTELATLRQKFQYADGEPEYVILP